MKRKGRLHYCISRIIIILSVVLSTGMLSGCGTAYPDLTVEEHDQIVEYASGLVLKYDRNNTHKLVLPEASEAETAAPEETKEPEAVADTAASAAPEQPETVDLTVPKSLNEIVAIGGIDLQYAGYEVVEEYPSIVTPGEIYFIVNATENNKLLVLKFDVTNNSGADYFLDLAERSIRYKIGWNGGAPRNALLTMLLNDMSTYEGELLAGEVVQLVVVCDLPDESASTVEPIELQVNDGTGIYSLGL